jgi:RND family efflux transporter MFP subunit
MKYHRTVILFPAVIFLLPVLLCCCSSKPIQKQELSIHKVKTESVTESNLMNTLDYVGVVEDKSTVAQSFSGIGTIEKVYVSEGQHVSKGQLLARLNPTSAQNLFDAAGSSLKQAQDGYTRLKSIHDNGSLPEIQMVDIETKLQQARSTYNIAKKNLEDCSLYAPVDGIIGKRMAEAGENAIPGKTVLTIMDISSVKIRFSVPEREISLIPSDCNSMITVTALGDKIFYGKSVEKSVNANAVSHTYPVHITLANLQKDLLPGMVCKVVVDVNKKSLSIVIPIGIIQIKADGQKFVWTARDGVAKRILVTTGEAKGNGVEIVSGLSAGDRIITEGYQKISEGDKISEK